MIKEIWRDIPGYEGLYKVSNLGRVKTFNYLSHGIEKILKNTKNLTGYYVVGLTKNRLLKQYKVHRLVASAFLGLDLQSKLLVCHKNDIKTDNNVKNLFIGTAYDNNLDKLKKGRQAKGEDIHSSKLKKEDVIYIRKQIKKGIKYSKLAKRFNINKCTISDIKYLRSWKWV